MDRNSQFGSPSIPSGASAGAKAPVDEDEFRIEEAYSLMDEVALQEGWNDPALDIYNKFRR